MDYLNIHLDGFQQHLLDEGYAPSAAKNYRFRASMFLKANPNAINAEKNEAREIIESYIATLPRNTAATIPASAVRRWWVSRFDEPYFNRLRPSDCIGDEAIDEECRRFEEYLRVHGNIADETVKNRVGSIRLFLYTIYPDGSFERGAVTLADIVDYHGKASASDGVARRNVNGTDLRSYAKFLRSVGCDVGPLDAISLSANVRCPSFDCLRKYGKSTSTAGTGPAWGPTRSSRCWTPGCAATARLGSGPSVSATGRCTIPSTATAGGSASPHSRVVQ